MKNKLSKLFGGNDVVREAHNALYTAIHNAADASFEETDKLYSYIEKAPRASLVCEIIWELEEMGYEIKKRTS